MPCAKFLMRQDSSIGFCSDDWIGTTHCDIVATDSKIRWSFARSGLRLAATGEQQHRCKCAGGQLLFWAGEVNGWTVRDAPASGQFWPRMRARMGPELRMIVIMRVSVAEANAGFMRQSRVVDIFGSANGNRTRISALKGPRANRCTIAPQWGFQEMRHSIIGERDGIDKERARDRSRAVSGVGLPCPENYVRARPPAMGARRGFQRCFGSRC